ncbi:MAG TPA: hypothetical protein PLK12_03555 [Prolixibacteraceae bacterium]|nr:hypothetical protein [Prolixibacteraceae bacterium]
MNEEHPSEKHKVTEYQLITSEMLHLFYHRPSNLMDENGNKMDAPPEGTLSLLALGHVGLIEWRKSRQKQALLKQEEEKE